MNEEHNTFEDKHKFSIKLTSKIGFVGFLVALLPSLTPIEASATVIPSSLGMQAGTIEERLTSLTEAVRAREGQVDPKSQEISSSESTKIAWGNFWRNWPNGWPNWRNGWRNWRNGWRNQWRNFP